MQLFSACGSRLWPVLALAAVSTLLLPACSKESPDELIASARTYEARGEHKAAIIQLRNALQQKPADGEARLLLGRASLNVGDPVGAQREFRKALEYGQPADVVLPLLARAMLELGEGDKLVAEFGDRKLTVPDAEAALRATVGQAQLQLGKFGDAAASFNAAAALKPDYPPAQLGLARLLAADNKIDDASRLIDAVIQAHPKAAEAYALQADLRFSRGDRAGARSSLEQAVVADGSFLPARYALIQLLINEKQFDAAAVQLEAVRSLRSDLRTQYFDAVIALGKNDLVKARDTAQQVLKRAPEHVPTLVLAGAVELQAGQAATAEGYLRKAVALAPQHAGARRMLVRTYLGAHQPTKALESIQPMLASGTRSDPQLLLLAGETYLANGDLKQASVYYAAATDSKPQESLARMRLGQIALSKGDADGGIRELEAAIALDGAPMQADMALIVGHAKKNDLNRALQAANDFAKKYPTNPLSQQLLGAVHVARNDPAAARVAFTKAVELSPTYLPAIINLARLDIAEKKPGDARKRLEALVAKDPKNDQALLALTDVMARTGAPPADIVATLKRAISANPQSVPARLALISFYLRAKDSAAALSTAQEAAAALRNEPRILGALAQAHEAAGETNQAIDTLNRWATLEPGSATPVVRLAAMFAKRQDYPKTIDLLRKAQKLAPDDLGIARDLVVGYLLAGKSDEAIKEAKSLQSTRPQVAVGFALEGDVHTATQNWGQAERAYRDALKVEPTSEGLALKLHATLNRTSKAAQADALAKKWLAEHPKDATFRIYLAERALGEKNVRSAVTLYQAVIALQPDNVVALNNLAWAAGQLGDPKAIGYAERAVRLAPENAAALDTLGTLLVSKGDASKGLEYVKKATDLAPKRHDIRLNYAKALVKAGRTEDARKELTTLQAVTDEFPGKSEIPSLLKQL
ncbi:MAG: XrtA/PEP-CTERM system TPR-repeat protein PrsT [Burkholderiaceae bacterium]